MTKQFGIFLLCGGSGALANFLSRFLYNIYLSFSVSIILAYITGAIVAFYLSRKFAFKDSKNHILLAIWLFFCVNLVGIAQSWSVSMFLKYYLLPAMGIPILIDEISHLIGIMVPAVSSFFGHKYITFGNFFTRKKNVTKYSKNI